MIPSVAFLVFDDFILDHVAGPMTAFEMAGRFGKPIYDQRLLSGAGGLIRASAGVALETERCDDAGLFGTLFVAGGFGTIRAEEDEALLGCIARHAASGARVSAVASGTVLLARAGVLDGRSVTTHWSQQIELSRRFPQVAVDLERPVVVDAPFWTCVVSAHAIEIARQMIEADFGHATARRATRDLVSSTRRLTPDRERETGRHLLFADLLRWARSNLRRTLSNRDLAEQCGLSEHRFLLSFLDIVGETPAKAVERLRIEAAIDLIETSGMPLIEIARAVGFVNPERMRRAFMRSFGKPPQSMRIALRERMADRVHSASKSR